MHIGLRVAVLGLAASLLSPAPAWAHAGAVRITPTPGSQLTQPPRAITVTFTFLSLAVRSKSSGKRRYIPGDAPGSEA